MLDADKIKVKLIDFLISNYNSDLIASEVSFYQGYRRADLIQLAGNFTTAFEIKSDKDKLIDLSGQLIDYTNTFSFCYLVTTEKHLSNARKIIPSKAGIILVNNTGVKIIKLPKENKRLCKHSLTLGLSYSSINYLTKGLHHGQQLSCRRAHVETKINLEFLKDYFYKSLVEKYQNQYKKFLGDRGKVTTLTDLYYLQSTY